MEDKLLHVDEAAEWLNCSKSHVYNMINSGELCSVRFGRAVRIPSSSIDSVVEQALERWELLRDTKSQ